MCRRCKSKSFRWLWTVLAIMVVCHTAWSEELSFFSDPQSLAVEEAWDYSGDSHDEQLEDELQLAWDDQEWLAEAVAWSALDETAEVSKDEGGFVAAANDFEEPGTPEFTDEEQAQVILHPSS